MTDISVDGHLVPYEGPPRVIMAPAEPLPSETHPPLSEAPRTIIEEERREPDTPIEVSDSTTVVVQTDRHEVREYALMLRTRLYNGGRKVRGTIGFIKGRLGEKTTYVFLGAGVAAASALPAPWSFISMGLSVVAAMVPDHVINNDGTRL